MNADLWTYRDEIQGQDVVGFDVEARDGEIGTIDSASYEARAGYIVVDTGFWMTGQKSLLPAAAIERVDEDEHKVYVDRTKAEIENAPAFDPEEWADGSSHAAFDRYYGGMLGFYGLP